MRPAVPGSPLEPRLRALVRAYVAAAIAFMLLPGTFLGVWNLLSLSADHGHSALPAAWIQAHGHAQIFGWIGSLVIGIGFFSLSKMGPVEQDAVRKGWIAWLAWVTGVCGTWIAGVYGTEWRILLPCAALLELFGYATFLSVVRRHKPKPAAGSLPILKPAPDAWMKVVLLSSTMFSAALLWHFAAAAALAFRGVSPALPAWADRGLLGLAVWGFLVLSVWGFNARWLSMFGGFQAVDGRRLIWAARLQIGGVIAGAVGLMYVSTALLLCAVALAAFAQRVFKSVNAANVQRWFVNSVRSCYAWSVTAAVIGCFAAAFDAHGGLTGASRHALTVGFIGAMVFTVGQRVLPTFCGAPALFSTRLRNASIVLLNLGCFLRVFSEIPAYEWGNAVAWRVLPFSAVLELTAVAIFGTNLLLSIYRPAVQAAPAKRAVA